MTSTKDTTADSIVTLNPDGSQSGTRVHRDKYDATRAALLKLIPRDEQGIAFADLPALVADELPIRMQPAKGSASWLTTTVKLDLEGHGLIERIPGVSPQRLRRTR